MVRKPRVLVPKLPLNRQLKPLPQLKRLWRKQPVVELKFLVNQRPLLNRKLCPQQLWPLLLLKQKKRRRKRLLPLTWRANAVPKLLVVRPVVPVQPFHRNLDAEQVPVQKLASVPKVAKLAPLRQLNVFAYCHTLFKNLQKPKLALNMQVLQAERNKHNPNLHKPTPRA